MEILGYVGYSILIFFAVTWTLGVRVKLEIGLPAILNALFYVVCVTVLWIMELNKLHSWWLLPAGFIFAFLCNTVLMLRIPLLSNMLKIIGSIYADIIRVGIPSEKIASAQQADAIKTVEEWAKKKK